MPADIDALLGDILSKCSFLRKRLKEEQVLMDCFQTISEDLSVKKECIVVGETTVADRFMRCTECVNYIGIADPLTVSNNVNNATKQIRGIRVMSIEEASKKNNVTFVILDNYVNKKVYNSIVFAAKDIYSVYDVVCMNDAISAYSEWSVPYITIYERLMIFRRKYETANNLIHKKYLLQNLIYAFLKERDFISTFKYIDEYIEQEFDDMGETFLLKSSLEKLFDKIKSSCKQREHQNKRDIILIWNDGIRFDELNSMSYLGKEIKKHAKFFTNAYTTVYDTRGTIASIFNKRYTLDDFYRSQDDCDIETSMLVRLVEENGYVFKGRYGSNLSNKTNTSDIDFYDTASKKMWDSIRMMLLCYSTPVFLFIHELPETHNPYQCPYINKDFYFIRGCSPEDYSNQIAISRSYWDEQLRFYLDFLEYDNYKILLSDHGKPLDLEKLCVLQEGYNEENTHVIVMITGHDIPCGEESRIFSLYNVYELVEYVLSTNKDNYDNMFTGYVRLQSLDRYNPGDIKKKLEDGTPKRNLMAFRAVRTDHDMLVTWRDGVTKYFILPDTNNDLSEKHQERLSELQKINGNLFLDIYNIPFFEASRVLY